MYLLYEYLTMNTTSITKTLYMFVSKYFHKYRKHFKNELKSSLFFAHFYRTLVYCMIFTGIAMCIGIMNGIPMFSYFKGCDPIKSGEIKFADQFIPLMVVKLFRSLPGFAGLFVSSIYSGMLRLVLLCLFLVTICFEFFKL